MTEDERVRAAKPLTREDVERWSDPGAYAAPVPEHFRADVLRLLDERDELRAQVEKLKEYLESYVQGSAVEAAEADRARTEAAGFRGQVAALREALDSAKFFWRGEYPGMGPTVQMVSEALANTARMQRNEHDAKIKDRWVTILTALLYGSHALRPEEEPQEFVLALVEHDALIRAQQDELWETLLTYGFVTGIHHEAQEPVVQEHDARVEARALEMAAAWVDAQYPDSDWSRQDYAAGIRALIKKKAL